MTARQRHLRDQLIKAGQPVRAMPTRRSYGELIRQALSLAIGIVIGATATLYILQTNTEARPMAPADGGGIFSEVRP